MFQTHFPVATLAAGAPKEFRVQASPEDYIGLGRTTLQVQAAVRASDGSAIHADQKVAPVQHLFGALFQQIDVKLNDRHVTPSLNTCPYKSYMETLLSHAKGSWLSGEGWFGKAHENHAARDPHNDNAEEGIVGRWNMIARAVPGARREHAPQVPTNQGGVPPDA